MASIIVTLGSFKSTPTFVYISALTNTIKFAVYSQKFELLKTPSEFFFGNQVKKRKHHAQIITARVINKAFDMLTPGLPATETAKCLAKNIHYSFNS